MLHSIYKPIIVDKIPDNCVQLLFSYYGITCKVFEYEDKIIILRGTKVAELNKDKTAVQEIKWLILARRNFTDNNSVVIYNLEFNS